MGWWHCMPHDGSAVDAFFVVSFPLVFTFRHHVSKHALWVGRPILATCVCCLLLAADGVGPCSGRVGLTWPIAGMPGEAGAVLFHLLLCSFLSIDMFSLK